jgi:hypothetical protein
MLGIPCTGYDFGSSPCGIYNAKEVSRRVLTKRPAVMVLRAEESILARVCVCV